MFQGRNLVMSSGGEPPINAHMRPEKYGFRKGCEEEVSRFRLKLYCSVASFTSKQSNLLAGFSNHLD
jgi:hypothetical protein